VFSQTRNFAAIAFTDANMYATSVTQRNVLKATVPDRMILLPKPACVIADVHLNKAQSCTRRSQAICTSVLPASNTPINQKFYHLNTLHLYPAQTRKRTKKQLANSYTKLFNYRHPTVWFLRKTRAWTRSKSLWPITTLIQIWPITTLVQVVLRHHMLACWALLQRNLDWKSVPWINEGPYTSPN